MNAFNFFERRHLPIVLLATLGLATRLAFIWYPNEVVFDEVHFGKFVSAYFTHEYYFDIHPPLGKLLIAGSAKLFGFRPSFDFARIGETYNGIAPATLRLLPSLAGGLIPAVVFGFLLALGIPKLAAFCAASFVLFDNAFLVQSHFMLIDSLFLFLGFSGLWLFFRARNRSYRTLDLLLASAVIALSVSVKWAGLEFLGLGAIVIATDHIRLSKSRRDYSWRTMSGRVALLFGVPAVIYGCVFWVHFSLLTESGPGDAFMSPRFLRSIAASTAYRNTELEPLGLLAKILETNRAMLSASQNIQAPHPYGSKFYSWPFMWRSVSYWTRDFGKDGTGYIYFLGNPFVWWISTFGVVAGLFKLIKTRHKQSNSAAGWLYIGYVSSFLPFAGVRRVLFLYHYLASLVFAAAIFSTLFVGEWDWSNNRSRCVWILMMVLVVGGFLFFASLSYGFPIGPAAFRRMMWLRSWI